MLLEGNPVRKRGRVDDKPGSGFSRTRNGSRGGVFWRLHVSWLPLSLVQTPESFSIKESHQAIPDHIASSLVLSSLVHQRQLLELLPLARDPLTTPMEASSGFNSSFSYFHLWWT